METRQPTPIAIICPNILTGIGLSSIIEKMMPNIEVGLYDTIEELEEADHGQFYHYFVSARLLLEHASIFLHPSRAMRTIVLTHGDQQKLLPQQFHTLNVCQTEDQLVRSILKLAAVGHKGHPATLSHPTHKTDEALSASILTSREIEVLRLIVAGYINKEIADRLHVSLNTIISHRKNLIEKLGIKSVSGLTIYAVTHGIIRAEEI